MQAADFAAQHDANKLCALLSWFCELYEHTMSHWMFI